MSFRNRILEKLRRKTIFSYAHVDPTDICNLNCYSCRRPRTGHSIMTPQTFQRILDKIKGESIKHMLLYWRGEPCLNPHLPELARLTKKLDPSIITYTSTNTAVPNLHNKDYVTKLLSNLNRLEICVDGYNQQSISKYRRGANWKLMLKNLETISRVKTDAEKRMRVLMFRWNEGREDWFIELAKKYNMDILRFGKPVINDKTVLSLEEAEYWLTKNPKYWRYRRVGDKFIVRSRNTCVPHCIITTTGEVAFCGVDMSMQYGSAGNVLTEPLDIIKERYWKFAPKMYNKELDICKNNCCCMPAPRFSVNVVAKL